MSWRAEDLPQTSPKHRSGVWANQEHPAIWPVPTTRHGKREKRMATSVPDAQPAQALAANKAAIHAKTQGQTLLAGSANNAPGFQYPKPAISLNSKSKAKRFTQQPLKRAGPEGVPPVPSAKAEG